jgi:hypothetical protein
MLLLSNLAGLLFIESQGFIDRRCIDEIINAEEYVEKFYKMNRSKNQDKMD